MQECGVLSPNGKVVQIYNNQVLFQQLASSLAQKVEHTKR